MGGKSRPFSRITLSRPPFHLHQLQVRRYRGSSSDRIVTERYDPVDRDIAHGTQTVDHTTSALAAGEYRAAGRPAGAAQCAARGAADAGYEPDKTRVDHQNHACEATAGGAAAGRIYRHCFANKVTQMFCKIFKAAFFSVHQ